MAPTRGAAGVAKEMKRAGGPAAASPAKRMKKAPVAKKAPAEKAMKDLGDEHIPLQKAVAAKKGVKGAVDASDAKPKKASGKKLKAAAKGVEKLDVKGAYGRAKDARPKTVFISKVPHGFYEDQMRAYFGQFGEVTRLRLSRNKKTGKSKHYAYVEFKHPEVAEVVAESMDNYLLFESVLKVRLMTNEECHPELWKGANRKFKKVPWQRKAREVHDRLRSEEDCAVQAQALMRAERKRRRLIKEAGIEYDFPGYASAASDAPAAQHLETPASPEAVAAAPKSAAKAAKAVKTPAAKTPGKRAAPAAEEAAAAEVAEEAPPPAKKAKTPAAKAPAAAKTPAAKTPAATRTPSKRKAAA
mmetsp:Transcript_24980/g.61579  ORF Transcript_24980/g.61579 Transcript_24980/m.61579 type:complete len:357 (+) Transcript_24980:295-1365(+)